MVDGGEMMGWEVGAGWMKRLFTDTESWRCGLIELSGLRR